MTTEKMVLSLLSMFLIKSVYSFLAGGDFLCFEKPKPVEVKK